MSYVLDHTRTQLRDNVGKDPWTDDAEIILAHPNGWGKLEQDFLLEAAVDAGLIPNTKLARSTQIHFVEEAEASARYCISTATSPVASQFKVRVVESQRPCLFLC